jgi:PleD family two-component response regulator
LAQAYGARLTVRFPLTQQHPQARAAESGTASTGLTVLVVEDDRDTRAFIARILTEAGAKVVEA